MDGSKARRTRNLRYKRPALASLGYHAIRLELWDIREACADIHWFTDQDNDTLLNALDGNEDEVWEFKMAFADLEAKADSLEEVIGELYGWDGDMERTFNDCTVALIGNRYRTIGFDSEEEDYFALTAYEEGVAQTEAGKRLMRRTKADMIATIGQCLGILLAFFDLRQQYDYLRACLISSDEDGNEGESKNLSRNNEFTLTIFPKPAEFVQPAEKALYHPTTRQHNKSV